MQSIGRAVAPVWFDYADCVDGGALLVRQNGLLAGAPRLAALGHVADLNAIEDVHSLLDRVNLVAVEVCGPLFEFGEVFNGSEAPL